MDANTIAMMSMIMVSTTAIVGLLFRQTNHLDARLDRLDTRVSGLEVKVTALDTKVEALDTKVEALNTKVEALNSRSDVMARDVSSNRERLVLLVEHGRRLDEMSESSKEQTRLLGEVRERLARVEGHLMGSEGVALHDPIGPTAEPLAGHRGREAG